MPHLSCALMLSKLLNWQKVLVRVSPFGLENNKEETQLRLHCVAKIYTESARKSSVLFKDSRFSTKLAGSSARLCLASQLP
jgi:hypothetical protein